VKRVHRDQQGHHLSIIMIIVDVAHDLVEIVEPTKEESRQGSKPATKK
jgi:hypothetical protein